MSTEEIRSLNHKVDKILFILNNDEDTGRKGLVAEVAELTADFHAFLRQYNIDQAVKRGKDVVWKIIWGGIGGGILAGMWALLKFLGSFFFKV